MTATRPSAVPPYPPAFDAAGQAAKQVVDDHMRDLARALAHMYALYRGPGHGTEVDRHVYRQQLRDLRREATFSLSVAFDLADDDAAHPWGRR